MVARREAPLAMSGALRMATLIRAPARAAASSADNITHSGSVRPRGCATGTSLPALT